MKTSQAFVVRRTQVTDILGYTHCVLVVCALVQNWSFPAVEEHFNLHEERTSEQ